MGKLASSLVNARSFLRNGYVNIAVVLLCVYVVREYKAIGANIPRWWRQRHIVENTDFYSQSLSMEYVNNSQEFNAFAHALKSMEEPPYIIFFDESNLDVTLNHVCNLEYMPGQLDRLVAVAFQKSAERKLNAAHPRIRTVTVDFMAVKSSLPSDLENRKYVTYQLVLLLRARICEALASRGIDFWAMQQDSIWTENFGAMRLEERNTEAHMFFDTVGNDEFFTSEKVMHGWICGSTFFVRASPLTQAFFNRVILMMRSRQSPDSSIMTYLCENDRYKCLRLPRRIISNSNWFAGNRTYMPSIVQVDHASKLTKMELFRVNNLVFHHDNGSCSGMAVLNVRESMRNALQEVKQNRTVDDSSMLEKLWFHAHRRLGFDPYNTRHFLRVHEGII